MRVIVANGREPAERRAASPLRRWRSWPLGSIVLLVVVAVTLLLAAGWRLAGGQIYVMTTPSMSPVTPVGSLVLDRAPADLRVGDTITFRPSAGSPTYTHRIVAILPGPFYKTQGWSETKPDPWTLSPSDVVGKTVFQVWGLGWYYKALPFWALGLLLWLLLVPHLRPRVRYGASALWWTALVTVPLFVWKPLVNGMVLSSRAVGKHRIAGRIVNTGLLPARDQAAGGHAVGIPPARTGVVTGARSHGFMLIHQTATLPWWGWTIVGVGVFSPLLVHLARALVAWWSGARTGHPSVSAPPQEGSGAATLDTAPAGATLDTAPRRTPIAVG